MRDLDLKRLGGRKKEDDTGMVPFILGLVLALGATGSMENLLASIIVGALGCVLMWFGVRHLPAPKFFH